MQESTHKRPNPVMIWAIRLAGLAILAWLAISATLTFTRGGTGAQDRPPPVTEPLPPATEEMPEEDQEEDDPPPRNAPEPATPPEPNPTRWTIRLEQDGTPVVSYANAPLVRAEFVFWGDGWSWKGSRFDLDASANSQPTIRGACDGLGLEFQGAITKVAPNALEYAMSVKADRDLTGITGGCLSWKLALESPALPAGGTAPELLPNDRGWRWNLGGGAVIEAVFEESQPTVYFERGRKSEVRTFFIGENLAAGEHEFSMRLSIPEGGVLAEADWQRYDAVRPGQWLAGALDWRGSPADLSHLNHKPAGKHGFVQAQGDQLVFEDGAPIRFWGGNLAAYALFSSKEEIEAQAQRIARLGFNLMRIHHHDSSWVKPNVFGRDYHDTQSLSEESLDKLDYWIKCLKDNGVYIWLDLHVGRELTEGDRETPYGLIPGWEEIQRKGASVKGFCYLNDTVRKLMMDFNEAYLDRVNPYTGLRILDDPAIAGLLITNENDLTAHFGNLFLPDKNVPYHNGLFEEAVDAFCGRTGLPRNQTWKTWVPGPSKLFLSDAEHAFNTHMLDHLRGLGARIPLATTNYWALLSSYSLPSLMGGDIIDVHSYGSSGFLRANPLYESNFISRIAGAQAAGKPVSISEWNVPYPATDRFCAPLYVAAVAALQGWDAPMIYNYAQVPLRRPTRIEKWSTAFDPALMSVMPAAALAFRRDVAMAEETYCIDLAAEALASEPVDAGTSVAIRTLAERSRVCLAVPGHEALPWHKPAPPPKGANRVRPDQAFMRHETRYINSDTGELQRDWQEGVFTLDTQGSQAFLGWVGGKELRLSSTRLICDTAQASVSVSSLTGQPIRESDRLLITAAARAQDGGGEAATRSEPVHGRLWLSLAAPGDYAAYRLSGDGQRSEALPVHVEGGELRLELGSPEAALWYAVERL